MFCAFFSLLMFGGGIGVLAWLGWQRIATHLDHTPGAKQYFAEHVVTPLFFGTATEETDPVSPANPIEDGSDNAPVKRSG